MPYCSGAVATVSSGPVSYKMPVPSHSRFTSSMTGSSYRTTTSLSSSLDRPYYSSLTRTIPRSYTSEYKSKYPSPSRTTTSSTYTRQGSLSDDSGISVSSGRNAVGRERSESREPSSGGYSRARDSTKTTSTTLGRRFGASTSTLSGISVTEMFSKYSPSNYTRYSSESTESAYSRSHSATATVTRRSIGGGGAVGGCSMPSVDRRSRLISSEVILQSNNNSNSTNNNHESSEEDNEDGNGNEAEVPRRFNSSPAALAQQNDGRVRRHPVRSSPSPALARKVYSSSKAEARLTSSEDEDDEDEEAEDDNRQDEEGDIASRRCSVGGVAGGATSSPSSIPHQYATRSESPKPTKSGNQSADADTSTVALNASPRFLRHRDSSGSSAERGGLTGLRNIGNTCFMNSVIQCLSNTRPLLEYLLGDCYLSDINTTVSSMKGALIKAFSTVIQELWRADSEDRAVNTTALKSQIQRFAPRFMGYCQQDAQEFLRYLLEGLHEDVNRVTTKPKAILTDVDDQLSDQQKALESWKRYLRMDNSKVVDIFVGQLKSTLRCTACGHCSVTFDPFWDLSLPIPVRTGQVRLQQCFDHFTREEVLDGDEKPTCSKCQMRRKCTKSFTIQKFPKILVLHLKRFSPTERFRGKLNVTVDFPLTGLDLSSYAASRGPGCMYNLYGVANHSGTTYSGHYTAYCKHPYTGEWHEYNDSRVSTISSRSVVSSEAYVLFFELSNHNSHL
ncbi:Ubiquitin carboxyl-terminal hydrolase 2 [Cryptotermes secundus]|uniref:Ubiquitin carboxyl-terminal hydrolase n=1 Tax=Cryptotermes secundus TaxID=105785 RepID=A0A2J7PNU1_9NEOP|nr:ubiquitin carboxyl-terminal hydrolase 2 isoform X1 [Cryptotermes secundus]PNF18004.1 Ubiquitin carboxyl-terminal hydrolase 2 [Cryptotermes secundus]PNF18005.1 Ubiquitin carboxyl-terminal hydrolase 2 [Cryptotermes secundus]